VEGIPRLVAEGTVSRSRALPTHTISGRLPKQLLGSLSGWRFRYRVGSTAPIQLSPYHAPNFHRSALPGPLESRAIFWALQQYGRGADLHGGNISYVRRAGG
jgi:hypothetical protein